MGTAKKLRTVLIAGIFLLACFSLFFLAGCSRRMKSDGDFIHKARQIMPIPHAEKAAMRYAGCVSDSSDSRITLHWVVSGEEEEDHAFLPMECERIPPAWEYTYIRSFEANECMEDVAMLKWGGWTVFCICNTDVRGMRWTDADGAEHKVSFGQIPYSAYPFLRSFDTGCASFTFLDAEGNELQSITE